MDIANQPLTEKGQKTLDALAASAQKNFYTKGYYKTTIKDITKDAGVSVGAFYLYFEDKLSVYKYLVNNYGKFIREEIRQRVGKANNRTEAERLGLMAYIELVRDHPDIYNIIWESLYIDREIFHNYYEDFAASYIRQLNKAKVQDEMQFNNVELVAYMFIGMHTFLGMKYGTMDTDADVEALADEFIEILTKGIFTNKHKSE